MNKSRRMQLRELVKKIEDIQNDIENILYDEQTYYDNMPENLQNSMRGNDSEDAINQIESAIDSLNEAIDSINDII